MKKISINENMSMEHNCNRSENQNDKTYHDIDFRR